MGNSYAGQLRSTRFEEVLHNSIEASLRSNTVVPRPVFSQLYLETEQLFIQDGGLKKHEGFCQAGKDLRLSSLASENLDVPPGFLLVGVKSPSLPDNLLVCAVDNRFLPDERGRNALLGFSGNCMGCGEKGFRYFTDFSNHINLKLSTQPKKQKHLKYHLYRNNQSILVKGAPICWRGNDGRIRQIRSSLSEGHLTSDERPLNPPLTHTPGSVTGSHVEPQTADFPNTLINGNHAPASSISQPPLNQSGPGRPLGTGPHANAGPPKKRHKGWSPESSASSLTENTVKSAQSTLALSKLSVASVITDGAKSETTSLQSSLQGSSSQLSPPEVSVTVPNQLLHACRLQPVIFKVSIKALNWDKKAAAAPGRQTQGINPWQHRYRHRPSENPKRHKERCRAQGLPDLAPPAVQARQGTQSPWHPRAHTLQQDCPAPSRGDPLTPKHLWQAPVHHRSSCEVKRERCPPEPTRHILGSHRSPNGSPPLQDVNQAPTQTTPTKGGIPPCRLLHDAT
ncbi:hypothetical protein CRENBAI_000019 [Crenichthys baileyi]|uniref:Growth regulating estrogen receptor binding 1 n=1 Tax=Crenichthys baileyi TaxID=28760 RepID=A0AAV9SSF4_9TELE